MNRTMPRPTIGQRLMEGGAPSFGEEVVVMASRDKGDSQVRGAK